MRRKSEVSRRFFQVGIFTLWITTIVQCDSTTLLSGITCPGNHKLCGGKYCYDPATEFCSKTGSGVTCINECADQCYDSAYQICIAGTLCSIGEDICEVKYDTYSGNSIEPSQFQCYNPQSQRCLNHTICYEKDRVCNGQCILYTSSYWYQVCANDNKTLCNVRNQYSNYVPNQIQLCNGSCYDTERGLKHCVNGFVQCVFNCSNECYNATTHVCINGALCLIGYKRCGSGSASRCYNPISSKCFNGTVCSNDRTCGGQCIGNSYQVCANDKRTLCNVTSSYDNYRSYQMHLCNGKCFDTSLQQCVNENISCIDDICGDQCYNSAFHVCLNNTVCPNGNNLCEVKYNINSGNSIGSPQLKCYDPQSQRCLNHTICYEKDRVCNGQCILDTFSYHYQVCANDNKTLCNVQSHYSYYVPNQIPLCNGSCFNIEKPYFQQCINGNIQCISNCSNICYDKNQAVCLNGKLCLIGLELCEGGSSRQCYNPLSSKCLNGTVCFNDRICGGQCIRNNYQVCVNGKTVCNVTKRYGNYRPNQIQICLGICYDSSLQQCSNNNILPCIHDPVTQQCVAQNISSSTTTTPSTSTISNLTSKFSISVSTATSSLPTSNTEASTSSITSVITETIASSSILSSLTSSYEIRTTDTTTFSGSRSSVTLALSSSTSLENTNIPSVSLETTPSSILSSLLSDLNSLSSLSSTMKTTGTDPDIFISSSDASSMSLSYSSDSVTLTTESSSQTTISLTPTFPVSSSVSLEDTDVLSTSPDTTSSPIFSSSSSTLANTEKDLDSHITSAEISSNSLPHSSNSSTLATKSSSQTTLSFTSTVSPQDSCCATKECTNGTDCCVPRVECRCYPHNRTRGYSQACKAIVIGENNNNSFVVAIAINDKKVIVINKKIFVLLLLSITITPVLLLVMIITSIVIVIYHKNITITLRLWYRSVKNYTTDSQRKQWESTETNR